jgi:parallel beta-helix repeat protein
MTMIELLATCWVHLVENPLSSCLRKGGANKTIPTMFATWSVRFFRCLEIFVLLFASVSPAAGQALSETWMLVGQVGGSTQAIAIDGNTAYAGIGLRLTLLNVTNPASPVLLGSNAPFADFVQDIAVGNNRAYVAAGGAGVGIVDVTDAAHPVTLGTWVSSGYAEGIAASGTTVYLADGPYGLRVLDVSNPSNPTEAGSAYIFNYAFDVAVSGNYTYVAAGGSGLLIANVADPSHPVEVGQFDTPGYAYGVTILGSTAYIADAWEGVQVVDISNPVNPVLRGNTATPGWALSVAVSGTTLYVGDGANGLRVLNVSNSTAPYEVGSYAGDGFVIRIAAAGNLVYLADNLKGVRIVNASNPASPSQVGSYNQMSDARRVAVLGSYAYVATGSEGDMDILNVADPTNPYQVGKFAGVGFADAIAVSGSYAYLGTIADTPNYLWVVNISNPSHPVQTAVVPIASICSLSCGAARDLTVQGNYIYVSDEFGLRIFDITTPANIHLAGQIELRSGNDATIAVAMSGNYAYLADEMGGVKIVNVVVPSNPQLVSTFPTNGWTEAVAVANNRLYAGNPGIQVADVTIPSSIPSALGSYTTPAEVQGVTVVSSELFASQGLGGIEVLEVSDPANITRSALLQTPGYAWQTVADGNLLYVADGSGGLLIFQKQAGATGSLASRAKYLEQASNEINPFQGVLDNHPPIHAPEPPLQPVESDQGLTALPPAGERVTATQSCVVISTADSGTGSLRQCLAGSASGTTITFNPAIFPPGSPATIHLASQLPDLNRGSVTIDASNAGVILDGGHSVDAGFYIKSSYNTIMGLQILNFASDGIVMDNSSQYNQIGGDHTIGSAPSGQGNVVDGNLNGISVRFASHNTIKGNFVGTNASGTAAGSGNPIGICISFDGVYNIVGGPAAGEKNIISGNGEGMYIFSTAAWNVVAGNYIGTDITGNLAIPNELDGIVISDGGQNNTVGGTTPAERNVISGNTESGIILGDSQNTVIGNYIGINAAGTAALPNKFGVNIFDTTFSRVGGTQPGEGNLISGNGGGVTINGLGRTDAIVIGNRIGLDSSGKPALGNDSGVAFPGGIHSFIGGLGSAEANVISGNGWGVDIYSAGTNHNWIAGNTIIGSASTMGIFIHDYAAQNYIVRNTITNNNLGIRISKGTSNTLRANAISGNFTTGIWLTEDGNQMLAAPVITSLSEEGISGTTCANCTVEIFSDLDSQGLHYEGFTTAGPTGEFSFSKRLYGPNVTATATDSIGSTSQFSDPSAISWIWFDIYLPLVIRNGP